MKNLLIAFFLLLPFMTVSANPISVGDVAPDFSLKDVTGKTVKLSDLKGKTVVLEWTNPGCPFVVGHYANGNMQAVQAKYTAKGVIWLTINSTNASHKDAKSPEEFEKVFTEWKSSATANLLDADGTVGQTYGAKTTPHMFIISANGTLAYNGAIDDDRSVNGGANAKINYVSAALDEVLAGKTIETSVTKPYGCSVKYQ
jgi:protein-disulfide isomerase